MPAKRRPPPEIVAAQIETEDMFLPKPLVKRKGKIPITGGKIVATKTSNTIFTRAKYKVGNSETNLKHFASAVLPVALDRQNNPSKEPHAVLKNEHAVIVFKQELKPQTKGGESVLEASRNLTARQLAKLREWVVNSGLQNDLGAFGEPSSLGTTDVTGSVKLLQKLQECPLVESLVID